MSAAGHLVAMVNDIASFFASESGPDAPEAVRQHLVKFWDPRMRAQILAHLDAGGAGLEPVAREAVTLLRTPGGQARQ